MQRFYEKAALAYFVVATAALMLIAAILLVNAIIAAILATTSDRFLEITLDSAGFIIIGFAIVETAKFIAEEEVFRKRELRSALESRRSLTKFITIIVIAATLEALVMIFKTSREDIPNTIFPAALLIAAMLSLVALGAYQWLSSHIEPGQTTERRHEE